MKTNKLITFSVSAVLVVVLAATVLMPVLEDATNDYTTTYYNTPSGGMYYTGDDAEHTISYVAGDTKITVDETNYTLGGTAIYAISDAMIILANTNGITLFNGATKVLNNNTAYDATITFSEGTATLVCNGTTTTGDYTWSHIVNPTGDYVLASITADSTVYYKDISEITTAQVYGGKQIVMYDGEATLSGVESTITMTTVTQANTNNEIKYISGAISISDGETTLNPSYVAAKASVTYEDPMGPQLSALLSPIPVLIIVSLVIAALGIAVNARRD